MMVSRTRLMPGTTGANAANGPWGVACRRDLQSFLPTDLAEAIGSGAPIPGTAERLYQILEANFQDDLAIHALRCTEQRAKGLHPCNIDPANLAEAFDASAAASSQSACAQTARSQLLTTLRYGLPAAAVSAAKVARTTAGPATLASCSSNTTTRLPAWTGSRCRRRRAKATPPTQAPTPRCCRRWPKAAFAGWACRCRPGVWSASANAASIEFRASRGPPAARRVSSLTS